MQIIWDKSNAIGVKPIDRQHEKFFGIINELLALSQQKQTQRRDLEAIILQLVGYAQLHFSTEERFFKKSGYPGAKAQIQAHQQYQAKMTELISKLDNPRTNLFRLSEEVANFSVHWLTRHLLREDRRYAIWLKK